MSEVQLVKYETDTGEIAEEQWVTVDEADEIRIEDAGWHLSGETRSDRVKPYPDDGEMYVGPADDDDGDDDVVEDQWAAMANWSKADIREDAATMGYPLDDVPESATRAALLAEYRERAEADNE